MPSARPGGGENASKSRVSSVHLIVTHPKSLGNALGIHADNAIQRWYAGGTGMLTANAQMKRRSSISARAYSKYLSDNYDAALCRHQCVIPLC